MNPLTAAIICFLVAVLGLLGIAFGVGWWFGKRHAMEATSDTRVFAEHIVTELEAVGVDPDAFSTVWLHNMCNDLKAWRMDASGEMSSWAKEMNAQTKAWRENVERGFPWEMTETDRAIICQVLADMDSLESSDEPTPSETSKRDSGKPTTLVKSRGRHASANPEIATAIETTAQTQGVDAPVYCADLNSAYPPGYFVADWSSNDESDEYWSNLRPDGLLP